MATFHFLMACLFYVGGVMSLSIGNNGSSIKNSNSTTPFVRTCPVSKILKTPAVPPSKFSLCTEFQSMACCSVQEEAALAQTFQDVWTSISGHCPGCLQNHKSMLCSLHCSPEQASFVAVEQRNADATQSLKSGVLRMCPNYCDRWWKSCVNTNLARYLIE